MNIVKIKANEDDENRENREIDHCENNKRLTTDNKIDREKKCFEIGGIDLYYCSTDQFMADSKNGELD